MYSVVEACTFYPSRGAKSFFRYCVGFFELERQRKGRKFVEIM
jgi:hypothetical protein